MCNSPQMSLLVLVHVSWSFPVFNSGYNSRAVCTAILLQTNAASIPDECFIWQT